MAFGGRSFSDIERALSAARRSAVLGRMPLEEGLAGLVGGKSIARSKRIHVAAALVDHGLLSQRRAHELTGVARDTIRTRTTLSKKKTKVAKGIEATGEAEFSAGQGRTPRGRRRGRAGGAPKSHPYTFAEAKDRITPMLARVVRGIDNLPPEACPNDLAVAAVTLNPEYIAKSYFPEKLLETVGLEPIGSRPRRITPEKRSKGREPEEAITTELFVMGPRSAFRAWRSQLADFAEDAVGAKDLPSIELLAAPTAREKVKGRVPKMGKAVFEVVLHSSGRGGKDVVTNSRN